MRQQLREAQRGRIQDKLRGPPGRQRMLLLFATEPDSCVLPPESQVKCVHMNALPKIGMQQRERITFVLNTGCIVIILPCVLLFKNRSIFFPLDDFMLS